MQHPKKGDAENMLGIAEKLLQTRDLQGSRKLAILAQEFDPLLEGPNRILAIIDVLLSSEKRVKNHHDWYALLGVHHLSNDIEAMKRQYHRLALLLHPDKSRFPFAKEAFNLIVEAWNVLSDSVKKSEFDNDLSPSISVPKRARLEKLPVYRRGSSSNSNVSEKVTMEDNFRRKNETFWTPCPYCYYLYEYPRVYVDCSLQCQNCERFFHGVEIASLPPLVPGKDAYIFDWGFFQTSFIGKGNNNSKKKEKEVVPPQQKQPWQPQ
ncbi:hypothetical protein TanjilG_32505 [Lupinus angustifolius]|uniref:J domain-containing protein n=1 Tax=Lupinus angustifolius TaxID=3871 RepID=A0A4P1R7W7_LUPAN|nr:PREDICTED: uncharacterized protein LOC109356467 [Lupinus angustifolius]OIW04313.1 hypothetical protein TanjilG_32505 [Lupinus angustifolius]